MHWKLLFTSCLIGICAMVYGQTPYLRNLSFEEGLPDLQVYDLHTDPSGYLYLACESGLFRYNGNRFTALPFAASSSAVSYIRSDEAGRLWCRDFSNKLYVLLHNQLETYQPVADRLGDEPLTHYEISGDMLYFSSESSLYRHNMADSSTLALWQLDSKTEGILQYFVLFQGKIALVTSFGLVVTNGTGQTLANWPITVPKLPELILYGPHIIFSSRGVNEGKQWLLDTASLVLSRGASLPEGIHGNYLREANKTLFWCTNDGLYRHDERGGVFRWLLPGKRVSDIVHDRFGNSWISTLDHGLFQMPYVDLHWLHKSPGDVRIISLSAAGPQELLAGSNVGVLYRLHVDTGLTHQFDTRINNEVQFLKRHPKTGHIFFSEGIWDGQNKLLSQAYFGKSLIINNRGQYVFATAQGAIVANPDFETLPDMAGSRIPLTSETQQAVLLRRQRARSLAYDSLLEHYYVCYSDGLVRYDRVGNPTPLLYEGQQIQALQMHRKDTHRWWIATQNQGVLEFNGERIVKQYGTDAGLHTSMVKKIVGDGQHTWLLTEEGLYYFHGSQQRFINYRQFLSLSRKIIFDLEALGPYLIMATSEGILRMPLSPPAEVSPPRLVILGVHSATKHHYASPYNLAYRDRDIRIVFEGLDFNNEGRVQAHYRLSEEHEWQALPLGVQELNLVSLPVGVTRVELRLSASDRYSEIKRLELQILSPIWMRWWFWLFTISLLTALIIKMSSYLHGRKTAAMLLSEQLARSQLTAMKAQMNPHFLYNVLNSIQGLIYADKKHEATEYLGKFSDLMRLSLNFSDVQWHELGEELNALRLYLELEAGRFGNEFSYSIRVQDELRSKNLQLPTMLIQPFVENALKHGLMHKAGSKALLINMSWLADDQALEIVIDDNGIGRKQATEIQSKRPQNHKSFATRNVASRLDLFNKFRKRPIRVFTTDKYNRHQIALGTTVTIQIPVEPET